MASLLLNNNKDYIDNNIKNYYKQNIFLLPYGRNHNIKGDYIQMEEYTLSLILRYLTDEFEYNIIIPNSFLFAQMKRKTKFRKQIFEKCHISKITRIYNRKNEMAMSVLTIKKRIYPTNIIINSFQLLEFIKISSSYLFQSMDYDIYLILIEYLKKIFELSIIKYSRLEIINNNITEKEIKTIYLNKNNFNKNYSFNQLISS